MRLQMDVAILQTVIGLILELVLSQLAITMIDAMQQLENQRTHVTILRTNLSGDNAVITKGWIVGVGFNQGWLQV